MVQAVTATLRRRARQCNPILRLERDIQRACALTGSANVAADAHRRVCAVSTRLQSHGERALSPARAGRWTGRECRQHAP